MSVEKRKESEMATTSELPRVIQLCVENKWDKYDDDGNGYLDKKETRQFVRDGSGTIKRNEMGAFVLKCALDGE